MYDSLLDEVLTEYYEEEFSRYSDVPEHKFSLKHMIAMKKTFKIYERNTEYLRPKPSLKPISTHKVRLTPRSALILVLIIFLGVLVGCTAAYFVSQGFRGYVHSDNTEIFPIDTDNCPSTIEKAYSLSVIPEGYELCEYTSSDIDIYALYRNSKNQRLVVRQTVKSEFNIHINTEGYDLQETNVNGCDAVYIEYNNDQGVSSMVIWDNEDYIIDLSGNFNKFELLNLAISNKIQSLLK